MMAEPRDPLDPLAAAALSCSSTAGADDDDPGGVPSDHDFAFAFNNDNFSDRILRLEISVGTPECEPAGGADWGGKRKRRREDAAQYDDAAEIAVGGDHADIDDAAGNTKNQDDDPVAMVDALVSGDEAAFSSDSSCYMVCSSAVRVKSIHISSPILAAKSPYFYKLFSEGMHEPGKRHVTLKINDSEEAAFMELLNFIYGETLTTTSAPAILDVLMAADKFEVASCMRHCSRLLKNLTMTPESALLYLDLVSSVHMVEAVLPLIDAAKLYLASHYKNLFKFQKEVLCLPLAGIEAILYSDDVQVTNEDAVYDFVIKWARAQYPNREERREILSTHLGRLIRFPFMSCRKLKKLLSCSDLDYELASNLVREALFFKAEPLYRRRAVAMDETSNRRYVERAYKYRPVKVVEFEAPFTQCIVYLDLKREECANLSPSGRIFSQAFHLAEQGFFLSAHCNTDQLSSARCFGLFLGMQEMGSEKFAVDYEFAAKTRPLEEFVVKYKGDYTFVAGGRAIGYRNLFQIPWESFIAEESRYFINDVLHLRAKLTIKPEEK